MALKKQNLLNSREVKNKTPISRTVPNEFLKNHIDLELIISDRFGEEFYEDLVGDIQEYNIAGDFEEGIDASIGEIYEYHGRFYQKISEDEEEVVTDPSCSDDWEIKDLFQSDCLNEVWERLSSYICWRVVYDAAPFIHAQYGPDGFTNKSGGNKESVDNKYLENIMQTYGKRVGKIYKFVEKKIKSKHEGGECEIFDNVSFIKTECGAHDNRNAGSNYGMLYRNEWES